MKIDLSTITDHERKARDLQSKMLIAFDDEMQNLPKGGFERLMCVSKYASVFGRLWQFFTKQGLAMKDFVISAGGEIEISDDVPMEKFQDLIAVPTTPKRDKVLEGRRIHEIEVAQPDTRGIDLTRTILGVEDRQATPDGPGYDDSGDEDGEEDNNR